LKVVIRNKQIIIYGIALAIIIFVLKWLEMRYVLIDQQLDTYIGLIAILFTGLGIWLALKLRKPKVETVIVEKEVSIDGKSRLPLTRTAHAGPLRPPADLPPQDLVILFGRIKIDKLNSFCLDAVEKASSIYEKNNTPPGEHAGYGCAHAALGARSDVSGR